MPITRSPNTHEWGRQTSCDHQPQEARVRDKDMLGAEIKTLIIWSCRLATMIMTTICSQKSLGCPTTHSLLPTLQVSPQSSPVKDSHSFSCSTCLWELVMSWGWIRSPFLYTLKCSSFVHWLLRNICFLLVKEQLLYTPVQVSVWIRVFFVGQISLGQVPGRGHRSWWRCASSQENMQITVWSGSIVYISGLCVLISIWCSYRHAGRCATESRQGFSLNSSPCYWYWASSTWLLTLLCPLQGAVSQSFAHGTLGRVPIHVCESAIRVLDPRGALRVHFVI